MFLFLIFALVSTTSSISYAMRAEYRASNKNAITSPTHSASPRFSLMQARERARECLEEIMYKMQPGSRIFSERTTIQLPAVPGYIIQQGYARIGGARILKESIATLQLNRLQVPEMLTLEIPDYVRNKFGFGCNTPYILYVAQYLAGTQHRPLTKEQVGQMAELILRSKQSPYLREEDYVHTPEGKIGLIDTQLDKFSENSFERSLAGFIYFYRNNRFGIEARDHLRSLFSKEFGYTTNYLEEGYWQPSIGIREKK